MATTEIRPGHAELGLTGEDLLGMYRAMLLARAVDERMWLMQRAGKIAFIISGQGHEGAQVGMAWPMRRGVDWMAPYYRSIASAMTFGMTAEDIITAHLAKADDVSSGGRQMPGHYGGAPYNIVSLSSPVGTQVLHAVGIAMGAWVRGDDVVAMTQFGEGTSNQGEIHEAMNFAGIHRLPVIFVCENNGYAISVPLDRQVGGGSVAARAAGYGMPGISVDGNDPIACYAAAKEAHERARRGDGPTLIEAHVVRLTSHSSDDDQRRYRDPTEVEALKERDPVPAFAVELRSIGVLDDATDERLRAEVKAEFNEASARAEARPEPTSADAHERVYAEPIPGGGTPEPLEPSAGGGSLMAELNILEAIRLAMDEEMARDDRVMILGEDVGKKGGVFGATDGLWAKYGDKRVLDTPLTEGMIAGAAMGAAVYGLRPIAEMQFADFVYPGFNQIVSEISRIHYRSNGAFSAPMVIRMPYGGGVHGALYHSQSNEAYFTSTVGLKVVAPGTPADAKGLLKAADPRPRPGHVLRAQEDVSAVQGRGPRRRHGRADRQGRRRPRGQAPVDLLLRLHAHGAPSRRRRRWRARMASRPR